MISLELGGFEADNLLAFLALVGLLRAVEAARPDWKTRVTWFGPPWHPALCRSSMMDERALIDAVVDGVQVLAPLYRFGGKADIDWSQAAFRTYACASLQNGSRPGADLVAALASDGAVRRGNGSQEGGVLSTALCTMFGQGHQHFLGQLERLVDLASAQGIRDDISATLFQPWRYEERRDALKFRWDPAEDRRYAHRASNPSGQAVTTVPGANLLGALGFALFVAAPHGSNLLTLAFGRGPEGRYVTWPIWDGALSLASIRALLAHPELVRTTPKREELAPYGVVELMRAPRIQTDKYFNFGPARPLWGAQAGHQVAPAGIGIVAEDPDRTGGQTNE